MLNPSHTLSVSNLFQPPNELARGLGLRASDLAEDKTLFFYSLADNLVLQVLDECTELTQYVKVLNSWHKLF